MNTGTKSFKKYSTLKNAIVIFSMIQLFCFELYAQEQQKKLEDLTLEEMLNITIVTASQKSQKISDAPATVLSYSAEQISQFGWRDLKDLFRALPGFDVSYDNQGEIRSSVTMRGIVGNQKILVLQDGQRYNPTTGERVVYGYNTPLNIYKRIEIVYGPASALYGADAYSGVINLISKDGGDIDGVQLNAEYVSTKAVNADFTFGKKIDEKTDFIMSARIYNGDDFRLDEHYGDYKDIVSKYSGQLGSLNKSYPIRNWNLFAKLNYGDFKIGFDWQHELESNAPTTIPSNYAYVENNVWGQDLRHIYVTHEKDVTSDFNLQTTISAGDYEINPASNFYIVQNTALSLGAPSYKYGYSSYIKGNMVGNIQLMSDFSLVTGLSYERVRSFPKTQNLANPFKLDGKLEDDLSMFADSNGYVFGLPGLKEKVFGERNYYNFGYFIQGEYSPLRNLSFTVGARYDYNSIYEGTFNPRAGIVYKPTEKTSVKALYGSAYIAPSNYYRWENWANPFALHIPNLDIKPEKLQNVSFSLTQYISNRASVRIELFQNELTDIITPIPASKQPGNAKYYNPLAISGKPYESFLESGTGYFVEINANQGKITTKGIEIEGTYKVGYLMTSLSYSYLTGEDNGAKLPKVSPHKIIFNASYTTAMYSVALTGRYYSDVQTMIFNSMYSGGTFKGAFLLYLNLSYNVFENLTLKLSAENLLNSEHYAAAPYGESVWIQPRAPQALRKIFVGLSANF